MPRARSVAATISACCRKHGLCSSKYSSIFSSFFDNDVPAEPTPDVSGSARAARPFRERYRAASPPASQITSTNSSDWAISKASANSPGTSLRRNIVGSGPSHSGRKTSAFPSGVTRKLFGSFSHPADSRRGCCDDNRESNSRTSSESDIVHLPFRKKGRPPDNTWGRFQGCRAAVRRLQAAYPIKPIIPHLRTAIAGRAPPRRGACHHLSAHGRQHPSCCRCAP